MRLTKLELLAYGPFRGHAIDFSARAVHLVFGRNEAGKSTTLRAITGLLYGISAKTTDGHVHKLSELRIGGVVEGRNGERVRLVRRKGLAHTLLDEHGEPMDENVLKRLLGGVSEETFRLAYGLDHDTLERGAKALLEGKGDLGESLFDASVGGGGEVQRLLAELGEEADRIYKARASSLPLNDALKAFAEAQKTVRERESRPEAFVKQEAVLADKVEESARAMAERTELAAKKTRLERARKRIPLERRRDLALVRKTQLGVLGEASDRIEALKDRFSAYERAFADRASHLADGERLAQAVTEAARRAGAEADAVQLDTRKERRLQTLLDERTKLAERLELAAMEIARLDRDLERLPVEDATEPSLGETRLSAAVERARRLGDIDARLLAEAAKHTRKRKDLETRAKTLFAGTLDELLALDLPAREKVEALEKRSTELARTLAHLAERAGELDRDAAALEKQIAAAMGDFAPPEAIELAAARTARDEAWAKFRQGDAAAAVEVERRMREADALADRMIREADRVTTLARLRSEAQANQAQLEKSTSERAAAEDAQRALAAEVMLPAPGFAETLRFLDAHAKIKEAFDDLAEAIADLADERGVADTAQRELATALEGETAPLSELLARAMHRLAALEKARQKAEELRRSVAEKRAQRDDKHLVHTRDEAALAEVQTKLAELLGPLGIPVDASVDEVSRAIEALRELFAVSDKRALASANAKIADTDVRAFENDLARTLGDVAPDLAPLDPRDAARTLFARGSDARENARELAEVLSRLAETEGEVTAADALLATDPEAAEHAIDESEARLSELDLEIARLNQDIGGVRVGLEKLRADSNAAEAAATAQQELARIRENAERWARVRLASFILGREIERYREENQGPLLHTASRLFARLTLGAFSGVKSGFDEKDRPCLVCVREAGIEVDVTGLSEGTRDQLYLALRLSSLLRRAEVTEPMPLVLDDVLIQLDDERASAALLVLAEVSEKMQVLFFTHHARLVELAKKAIPDLVVHELAAVRDQHTLQV